jgi:hypothetical protein
MLDVNTTLAMPRVNGEALPRFVGKKVLLVGKLESLEGGTMLLRTSDGKLVRVALKLSSASYTSDFIEFEATVNSADSLTEVEHTSFGSSFGACSCLGRPA